MRKAKFTATKLEVMTHLFEEMTASYERYLKLQHALAEKSGLRHRTIVGGNVGKFSKKELVKFCKEIAEFTDVITGPELSKLNIGRANGQRPTMGISYPYRPSGEFETRDAHIHADEIGLGLMTEVALAADAIYLPGDQRTLLSVIYHAQLVQKEMVEQEKGSRMKFPFLFTPATRRGRLPKIILVGKKFWQPLIDTFERMLKIDAILSEDREILIVVDSLVEAKEELLNRKRQWRATFSRTVRKKNKGESPEDLARFHNEQIVPAYDEYIAGLLRFQKKSGQAFRLALFGGHRLKPESEEFQSIFRAITRMSKQMDVITGGGPGAMLAANNGAATSADSVTWGIGLDFADQRIEGQMTALFKTICFGIRLDMFAALLSCSICGAGGIGTLLEALYLAALAEQERKGKDSTLKRQRPVLKNPMVEVGLLPRNYFIGWVWEPLQELFSNMQHEGFLTRRDAEFNQWCPDFEAAERKTLALRRFWEARLEQHAIQPKN